MAVRDTSPASARQRGVRVLVADDDKDAASALAMLLAAEGYEVREVYRGDAVLERVREFRPHAVLLDIGMPGMSGWQVAQQLHGELGEACPLLVAVTGWKKSSDRILGTLSGFHHYLTKPCNPEALLRLLEPLAPAK